ncbi:MAG: hypothetical protein EOM74_00095 [Methanomicrobia archaeon]|nr:hypothetical protein [Methanomicrobia archaeon]
MKQKLLNFLKEAWRPLVFIATICLLIYVLSLAASGSDYFIFWGDPANQVASSNAYPSIRATDNFNWTFIFIFTIVVFVYAHELKNKNYRGLVASLSLYGVHWLYEIANAIIGKASGHALWTVSAESTSFILLIGVSWELSMMFALAGLIMSKLLPDDPKKKILGMNNRLFFAIANAAFFGIFEIFLAGTPAFIWVYPWWGAIPVFITTYIPFFLAAFLVPDTKPRTQRIFLMSTWGLVIILLAVLIPAGII